MSELKSTQQEPPVAATRVEEVVAVTVFLPPKAIACLWAVLVPCFLVAYLIGQYAKYQLGHDALLGFVPLFNLDAENNLPTWFSSVGLLLASLLLALISAANRARRKPYTLHWIALSVMFLALSIDETASLHERLSGIISSQVATGGVFLYAWTIPATLFIVVFGFTYLRFLFHLSAPVRNLFVAAGIIFVAGALGMEMVEGKFVTQFGQDNLTHSFLVALEEGLEMSGVGVFLYALALYMQREFRVVRLQFGRK